MLYSLPFGERPAFEFDEAKSAANRAKHGIDFIEAQALWTDQDMVTFRLPVHPEPRFAAVGRLGTKHWTAIYTPRGGRIRLISVRRSRIREARTYEDFRSRQGI